MEAEFYLSIDFKIDGNEDDDFEIGQLLRINSNNEGTSGFKAVSGLLYESSLKRTVPRGE